MRLGPMELTILMVLFISLIAIGVTAIISSFSRKRERQESEIERLKERVYDLERTTTRN